MARQEFFHDPDAPAANSLAPTAFAAVRDERGWLLLVRRCDTGNWELPGGRVELGESVPQTARREVAEESGVDIEVTGLAGVYSDPGHVMVYPDTGESRQQFAVCVHAVPAAGEPREDHDETCASSWVDPGRSTNFRSTRACACGSARPSTTPATRIWVKRLERRSRAPRGRRHRPR